MCVLIECFVSEYIVILFYFYVCTKLLCLSSVSLIIHFILTIDVRRCICMPYMYTSVGPFGERDNEQVFVQRVVPETDKLFVRLSSNGQR